MLGAEPDVRLREREALFLPVRWMFVAFGVIAASMDEGASAALAWSTPVALALVNVAAWQLPRRLGTPRSLALLAVIVNVIDGALAAEAMFNYAEYPDTATNLLFLLVVLEAAMRWAYRGGLIAGGASAVVNVIWMIHREAEYGIAFTGSTALARAAAFLLSGLMLGMVIRQLERASIEIRRSVKRTDVVSRFAIESPRLSVDDAARLLAEILHDDLGFEFAAVVVADEDDPGQFRLVATAGYEETDVAPYQRFPVTVGIVGRCFRTGETQLLPDVTLDPDYLEVDARTQSEMTVPLRARGAVFGAIDVGSSSVAAFDQDDLMLLEAVATQLARAFDNARLAEIERRTIAELEEISAMKDDFIAIANHELRTPVTSIAGFAQSLLRQRDVLTEDELDDAIERIARQSAHLRLLIEDLLTVPGSRERRGLDQEVVCIAELARDVTRDLDPHNGAHHLAVDFDDHVPAVYGDRSAVRRVLTNLVSNALKYSAGGPVVVRGRRDGPMVHVEVTDEGPGLHPSNVAVLFTKFGRPTDREVVGGMGLGLFIVKELVESMGGTVGVRSEPGAGSCFWFRLLAATEVGAEEAHGA